MDNINQFQYPKYLESYKTFVDNRGRFSILDKIDVPGTKEIYSDEWSGWNFQTNVSISHPGVLRGMHWQRKYPQAKLVKVLYGEVLDVVVDIRRESPTFKKVFSFKLTESSGEQLFVPRGFAHGFYNCGSVDAVFHYNVDNIYSPKDERGIRWDSIDFEWPIPKDQKPILSVKDSTHPSINDIPLENFEDIY